ncbi:MAG: sugar transferase [Planctomycetes bacterium]|nr:sugar transferase [Planctomycetota bacterium]
MSVTNSSTIARKPHHTVAAPAWRVPAADLLRPPAYFRWKVILDRTLAALLLAPGLPMIALMVLLVRLTSRGPGIFRQVRVGQRGRKFTIHKIRTMRHDAEAASGPVWTQARDPRITLVGRVLRKFHLDELPQLLNVLKGEMSLIGPRPERPEFVHVLAEAIPGYLNRLAVPPGVTGLAQVNLPPDTDLDSVRRKLALDCEYIRRAGPWLDIRLFSGTLLRIFKVPERWLLPVLGLRRKVTIPAIPEGVSSGENGNGSDHAPATPTSVLIQAAGDPAKGDGDPSSHRHRRSKHLRGYGSVKPR